LYHFDNLLLHLMNVALAAYLSWQLLPRIIPTLIAAALFALHPLRVESVVCVAKRKDLLYTCFFLLSLVAYVRYARGKRHRRVDYAASLLFQSGAQDEFYRAELQQPNASGRSW